MDLDSRLFLRLCLIATCILLPVQAWAQTEPANESEPPDPMQQTDESSGDGDAVEPAERVAVEDVVSDGAIRDRLVSILDATERYEDLEVNVRDSVVFLTGSVSQAEHREWAGRLARNTESVAAVVNDLRVERQFQWSGTLDVVTESLRTMWHDALERSPLLLAGLVALFVSWFVNRIAQSILGRILSRSGLRTGLRDLALQLTTIAVWLVGIMVAAVIIFPGMTPAKVLTVLGLSSVAVGFAFKDIFENFFAGILILWKYPFDRGDFISCEGVEGRIEDITIRMTMIRQVDGQLVVVPNSYLFKNPVDVLTNKPHRRITVICGVAYGTDLAEARKLLIDATQSCDSVKRDPPVEIFAQEFADSSINFEVTWWTSPTPLDVRKSRDEVVEAVKRSLDDAGIEIPFPQRTLWFKDTLGTRRLESAD